MAYKIILSLEAVEDLKALRAFDRAAVRDAMKEHLRVAPTKTLKQTHLGSRHSHLREGWKYVATLPSGRIIIEN